MQTILAAPCGTTRSTNGLSVAVAFAQSTRALAGRGKSTQFAMLVNGVADPVDFWIATNGIVVGVNADNFKVLVGSILGDPVRVQDTKTSHATSNTFLKRRRVRIN